MTDASRSRKSSTAIRLVRPMRWLVLGSLLLLTVAACGKTAPPATPAVPPPTATVVSVTQPAVNANVTVPPATVTPGAGEPTVGQLADRMAAAWGTVRTYRATTVSTVTQPANPSVGASLIPRATPLALATTTIIDENVLPDRRHLVQLVNGQTVVEYLIVGGQVWVRGPQAPGVTPAATPDAWIAVGATPVAGDTPFASTYADLAKPVAAPYAGLSAAERERIAHPIGSIAVDGRTCQAYRMADTTLTGEKIDITIALDEGGLPCSIETRSGSSITVTTFTFNLDLTIVAPPS